MYRKLFILLIPIIILGCISKKDIIVENDITESDEQDLLQNGITVTCGGLTYCVSSEYAAQVKINIASFYFDKASGLYCLGPLGVFSDLLLLRVFEGDPLAIDFVYRMIDCTSRDLNNQFINDRTKKSFRGKLLFELILKKCKDYDCRSSGIPYGLNPYSLLIPMINSISNVDPILYIKNIEKKSCSELIKNPQLVDCSCDFAAHVDAVETAYKNQLVDLKDFNEK